MLERADEHIAESARKALRTTSAVADAIEDGGSAAKRVAKQDCDAAKEFLDDTTKRLQRHPTETVVASLAVGVVVGIVIGWSMKRRYWKTRGTSPGSRTVTAHFVIGLAIDSMSTAWKSSLVPKVNSP